MFQYISNTDAGAMATALREAKRCAVIPHARPDGDALGSSLAVKRCRDAWGLETDIYLFSPAEASLMSLAGPTPINMDVVPPDDASYDLVVVIDTGAWSQLEPMKAWLESRHERVINIDHHARGDDVGARRYIDTSAASATLVLLDILDAGGVEVTGGPASVAEALFLGLATDTGWFRHSNADARAYAATGRLLECGVDRNRLYQVVEQNYPPARLHFLRELMNSLVMTPDGSAAVMSMTKTMMDEIGSSSESMTGLVNIPFDVGSIRVAALLTQVEPNLTKLSLRSKPAPPGGNPDDFVDVNALAQSFGGGGHVHAAGARWKATLDETRQKLMDVLAAASA